MTAATIQMNSGGEWADAATLELMEPEKGIRGACRLEHHLDYVVAHGSSADEARFLHRLVSWLPVQLSFSRFERWPAFLDDIRPAGAAERWWIRRLGLERAEEGAQQSELLLRATMAPVGNLRIAEALPKKRTDIERFPRQAVVERNYDFLEYAAEFGGSIGGATGAGGEAPKLLLRVSADDEVWIDTWQDQPECPDAHYLVKFARNRRDERDQQILRAEYYYYRALAELGVATADTTGMWLEEGDEPSLWLPRFDVTRVEGAGADGARVEVGQGEGRKHRHGMESLYALIDAPPASYQSHWTYLDALHDLWCQQGEYDAEALTYEYVRRELLNVVLGNSDNHGRNTALLRTRDGVRLAPVFDLAPMKLDASGIIRSSRWEGFERGASIDWRGILGELDRYCESAELIERLSEFAGDLSRIYELLGDLGLPDEVLHSPIIGLKDTATKLERWGLL